MKVTKPHVPHSVLMRDMRDLISNEFSNYVLQWNCKKILLFTDIFISFDIVNITFYSAMTLILPDSGKTFCV